MKRFLIPTLAVLISFGSIAYAATPPQTVNQGGTGWGSIQTGGILYGNTTLRLATTTQGTGGYVLSWSGGIPTWVATSSIQNITLTTTGSSGAATLNGLTLNIPQYTGGGSGTVGTSTNETAGFLPYWTTTSATPALLGKVATTSLTLSGFPANIPTTLGKLVGGSDTTWTWWGLATTSQPASSNLLTSNGAAGVYGTATSTLSASSPLTGSFTQVGSGGSLGCTTASAGVAGCLNSTDWSTFNGKESVLTFSTPLMRTANNIAWVGLATTSQPASSNLLVSNGGAGVYGVATSSETCSGVVSCTAHGVLVGGGAITITGGTGGQILGWASGVPTWVGTTTAGMGLTYNGGSPGNFSVNTSQNITTLSNLSTAGTLNNTSGGVLYSTATTSIAFTSFPANLSGTLGALIGGANSTLTWWGLATTSQPASSNLLVSNGGGGVYGVATTSETCSTPLSCTAHAVLTGGGAITIANAVADGSTKGAASFTAADFNDTTGNISLDYVNGQAASASVNGFLSSANWSTFNNKQASGFQISTSSTIGISQLAYFTGVTPTSIGGVATTSLAVGASISNSGTLGAQIGGTASSLSLNMGNANSWTALQTFSLASSTQLTAGTNTFYIDSAGRVQAKDTTNAWTGVVSPTRTLILSSATTTAWIASSTGAYLNTVVAPFAGTIRTAKCTTDAGTLNVDIYHTTTHLALFNASTTVGTITFSSNNTFTAGEKIYMAAGTPASSPTSVSCSVQVTETY